MPKSVRRVVTGHDAQGRAVVVSDGEPPVVIRSPMHAGLAFHEIWNTGAMPMPIAAEVDEPTGDHSGTAPPRNGAA